MIKTKTLFILGAGASYPFGYPTSIELRHKILYGGLSPDNIARALNKGGGDFAAEEHYEQINKFIKVFKGAGVYSIDSFLEQRQKQQPELVDIGKIFIARMLIPYEEDDRLRDTKDNWYMYLFDRLKVSFDELGKNNISFITFNYDRSLEYFLFEAIQDLFRRGSKECTEMMKNFPIVHLYGQLDPLPWQDPIAGGKKYSSTNNLIERLRAAPENIKLISDERDIEESEKFQKAYKLIQEAERIFFLGFSFDETNLKRLNLDSIKQHKQIHATVYKVEPSKLKWIKEYFSQNYYTSNYHFEDNDALTLLKNYLEIE